MEKKLEKHIIPQPFLERMKKLLGNEYERFYNEITSGTPTRAFYTCSESASITVKEELKDARLSPVPFYDNGFYFDYDGIGNSPLHHSGAFYIQDPSAMSTVCSVDINKGDKILDMCASPGGKTILAAMKAGKEGLVVSNEYSASRCKTLVGNIERMGLSNVICVNSDAADDTFLPDTYCGKFDLVITDAPCSGEGMFRKYPEEAISEWSEDNVKLCAVRQAKILDNAAKCVKSGGKLLYSTCTFSLEENEMTIDAFLNSPPEFSLISVKEEVKNITADGYSFDGCKTQNINLTRRFYPHISKGEGQFIALMQKNSDEASCEVKSKKSKEKSILQDLTKEEKQALTKLFKCLEIDLYENSISKYGENIIYCEHSGFIPQKHVFSCGVKIGEFSKNYITPHHSFFKCFGGNFKNSLDISGDVSALSKYLHGECIEADIPDGWCAITYRGFILGGGKAVSGVIKNHYPKGLRMK